MSKEGAGSANLTRFSGFAELYDSYRPTPPRAIAEMLSQIAQNPHPVVVDLGSGSGLSSTIWSDLAAAVIGVEPNADMRAQAARRAAVQPKLRFIDGLASATGLDDESADIVTCSQSLHWMEPGAAFAEAARILRRGGVFAAYDCDLPPTFDPACERAYAACTDRAAAIERERHYAPELRSWSKSGHLERLRQCGCFRYVKEAVFHHVESGSAERLVGLALSQGQVASVLKHGVGEDEIGITALRETSRRSLGRTALPWYWSYRVRFGVK